MLKGIIISFLLTAVMVLLQILIAHIFKPRMMFRLVGTIFLLSIPAYVILSSRISHLNALGFANGLVVHFLIFFNYVQCLYYFTRPVTLRMTIEFLRARGRTLTIHELKEGYNSRHMIQSRLDLLVVNGYAMKTDFGYELTGKGKYLSKVFLLLRKLFGVPYYLEQTWADERDEP